MLLWRKVLIILNLIMILYSLWLLPQLDGVLSPQAGSAGNGVELELIPLDPPDRVVVPRSVHQTQI